MLRSGHEFFFDGQVLKFTADWVTFYTAPGTVALAPPGGTYPTWSDRGAGVAYYQVARPLVPSVETATARTTTTTTTTTTATPPVAPSRPGPAPSSSPASRSSSSPATSSGTAGSSTSTSSPAGPAGPGRRTLPEAVAQAGLMERATAEDLQFFFDGTTLKFTDDWVNFYDEHQQRATAPAPGAYGYWSVAGTGHADFDATDPEQVADDADADDIDDVALVARLGANSNLAKDLAERERERKARQGGPKPAPAPVFTNDGEGYLLADGARFRVNGCTVFWRNGTLWAEDPGDRCWYQVRRGDKPVSSTAGLRIDDEVAQVNGDPLSLDPTWHFRWGVVIGDVDKYATDAFWAFADLSTLELTDAQCHAQIGAVNGIETHLSVSSADVRAGIKRAIRQGLTPDFGFLHGARFHVTVEVHGRASRDNPHVFDNSAGWTGDTGALGGAGPARAIQLGRDWLRDHR
ncbi:MAG TPA: hypothetical protein VH478_17640 [Trebonia sp.]|nr:hypothetical protein [Trebonia sp.]